MTASWVTIRFLGLTIKPLQILNINYETILKRGEVSKSGQTQQSTNTQTIQGAMSDLNSLILNCLNLIES